MIRIKLINPEERERAKLKVIIMAGGKGTRIAGRFPDIPKPLIPITSSDGVSRPVREWEIDGLKKQGFTEIILTVGYRAQQIIDYFGDGSKLGVSITYWVEDVPLGNAGALIKYRSDIGTEPFLLLIADAMFDVDFNRMVQFHQEKQALVTLFTHPNSHPYDSSVLITDAKGAVSQWLTKEDNRPEYYKNRVNAGLQIMDPLVLDMYMSSSGLKPDDIGSEGPDGKTIKADMDRQILKPLCGSGRMYCYDSPEYCKDMGTPERFDQVSRDFQNGTVSAKNLEYPQKAIFLDRDGTINRHIGFLRKTEELELLPGAANAIKQINGSGYLAIVITNQPVIARGEVSVAGLEEIHNKLETELGKDGAYIDGLYYCPHHPDKGFDGEVPELKIQCECRKPKPGMILKASKDYNIDLSRSWMVGDGANDVLCGKNAGCKTALIGSDESLSADIMASSLSEAVKQILNQ